MSATTITSETGALKSTIGKRRDGTYTVRSYLGDMEIWFQDGFPSKEAASEWAVADMKQSEEFNGWAA